MTLRRDGDGKYPAYAWPGGYPIVYVLGDGASLCPSCANGEHGSDASETADDPAWRLVDVMIHYEGPPEVCAHCGAEIESAYGDPDDPDDPDDSEGPPETPTS